jgi:hypothetical protein
MASLPRAIFFGGATVLVAAVLAEVALVLVLAKRLAAGQVSSYRFWFTYPSRLVRLDELFYGPGKFRNIDKAIHNAAAVGVIGIVLGGIMAIFNSKVKR